ncbi:NADH-FMN oxidoreductase RutF, flavin reductase (DIM6/NTAB) family [Raineyella antarctica]|uniref:NADH-FMN oxidoreductase RutF, flavin reductase (DIM6/NTAB) family n=1 Tax=Raineyella antarctica TaxID=1577474 RepID=A0A1G6GJ75_9ACTN|nr:flavin reductase family protein [Raineyella antarctica]SDB81990.1 NADH-FMN oxidoreductase RutF, flavin reductase (DIM6/NTAB) family [Raineyella antarctica]
MAETLTDIDGQLFRNVMGHYPTGVVIVTGVHPDGEPLAMVVGTFTSVSLEPPLVAFLPMKTSRTFLRLQECPSMCVNVLTGKQEHIGRTIASRRSDKFAGLDWYPSPSGNPILADSLAWVDVRLVDTIEAGDHWIAMCAVTDLAVTNPVAPLIFFQGGYGSFVIPSLIARIEADITEAVMDAESARPTLERLAVTYDCEVTLLTVVNPNELATISSAVGPSAQSADGLGLRIPIIPPIADVYVAEGTPEEQEDWLSRARGADEGLLQTFRDRLAFARERGYLMSFLPAGNVNPYASVTRATQRYARGELTPAQEREIRSEIILSQVSYEVIDIDPSCRYDVGMLVATIHDAAGRPVHMLRMAQFPRDVAGRQVQEWIDGMLAGVRQLEHTLFPTPSDAPAAVGGADGPAAVDGTGMPVRATEPGHPLVPDTKEQ